MSAESKLPNALDSSQVSWWSVHEFIAGWLDNVSEWPLLGSPAWCALAPDDARKWAAVLDGGQHHALRLELNQEASAQASRDVSSAADWGRVGAEVMQRNDFYAARPYLRRAVS